MSQFNLGKNSHGLEPTLGQSGKLLYVRYVNVSGNSQYLETKPESVQGYKDRRDLRSEQEGQYTTSP